MVLISILWLGFVLLALVGPWLLVELVGGPRVSADPSHHCDVETAIVLGCAPLGPSGAPNRYFEARLDACAARYAQGGLKRIIVSGEVSSRADEPVAMARGLVARGIPDALIVRDPEGLRTLASVRRAKQVYGVSRAVVVSQRFHNLRAIVLGRRFGLDLVGLNAEQPGGRARRKMQLREVASRLRMLWDLWPRP